jgi:hypothetical protein
MFEVVFIGCGKFLLLGEVDLPYEYWGGGRRETVNVFLKIV